MLRIAGSLHQRSSRARGHFGLESFQCMVHRSSADLVDTLVAQYGVHLERASAWEDSRPRPWLARDIRR